MSCSISLHSPISGIPYKWFRHCEHLVHARLVADEALRRTVAGVITIIWDADGMPVESIALVKPQETHA